MGATSPWMGVMVQLDWKLVPDRPACSLGYGGRMIKMSSCGPTAVFIALYTKKVLIEDSNFSWSDPSSLLSKKPGKRYIVHLQVQNIHGSKPSDGPEIKNDRYFEQDIGILSAVNRQK
jgi:hypothetical protein